MSWRRILVYYLLAVLVAAHLYSQQSGQADPAVSDQQAALPFVTGLTAELSAVTITFDSAVVRIERRPPPYKWAVTAPEGLRVPADLIEALIETLTTIAPIQKIADDKEGGSFGLSPPLATLVLIGGDRELAVVEFGRTNPTGTAVYVTRNHGPEVYLLGLNARYYVDLVYESLEQQLSAARGR